MGAYVCLPEITVGSAHRTKLVCIFATADSIVFSIDLRPLIKLRVPFSNVVCEFLISREVRSPFEVGFSVLMSANSIPMR
jgi:hypothetical protein